MMIPQPYLTVAGLISGFGVTVFMFRIQRELQVRNQHPDWPNWLAWADYLVLGAIVIAIVFVVQPLMFFQEPGVRVYAFARGGCAAASLLMLAYPFAILDHYRIEIGAWRIARGEKPTARHKGEPIEKVITIVAALGAAALFLTIVLSS
jgi:hypothetical protein